MWIMSINRRPVSSVDDIRKIQSGLESRLTQWRSTIQARAGFRHGAARQAAPPGVASIWPAGLLPTTSKPLCRIGEVRLSDGPRG